MTIDLIGAWEAHYGRPFEPPATSDVVDEPDLDDWTDPSDADHAADRYFDR